MSRILIIFNNEKFIWLVLAFVRDFLKGLRNGGHKHNKPHALGLLFYNSIISIFNKNCGSGNEKRFGK